MTLTYNDLPAQNIMLKLSMTSFSTPQKNLAVYKLTKDLEFYYDALENERHKCFMEFGEPDPSCPGRYVVKDNNADAFNAKMADWCQMEIGIEPKISPIDLTFDDFANCAYHKDKRFWLSSAEIMAILEFVEKLKKEEKK